ncbi:MAG TPA: RNA polymerase sigma factor SigJ [Longimicrobium sp.]|nr:RNA polymerase sigma factor SigJ [Longimicrobium sp.]
MSVLDPSAEPDVLRHRPRLLGLGYRMLGDLQEAEDLVQEAYLRWYQEDRGEVRAPEAWLLTVVTRLAVDRLRRVTTARESYIGPWLPEPVATTPAPDREAERASDLSVALLLMLERLSPEERAAFLLRDVFDTGYGEIAGILSRSEASVRQMVHRARERVRGGPPRFVPPADVGERLLRRFLDALARDDREAVLALLAPGVTLASDGGGVVTAARNVVVGADHVMRLLLGLEKKYGLLAAQRMAHLHGQPALIAEAGGEIHYTTVLETDGERIHAIYIVLNPHKLRRVNDGPAALE